MQKRAESRPIFWKFKLKRHYKPHLSVQVVGQMGTGTMTLCGTRIVGIHGSARTVLTMEGDECAKCAEKMGQIATAPNTISEGDFARAAPPGGGQVRRASPTTSRLR